MRGGKRVLDNLEHFCEGGKRVLDNIKGSCRGGKKELEILKGPKTLVLTFWIPVSKNFLECN